MDAGFCLVSRELTFTMSHTALLSRPLRVTSVADIGSTNKTRNVGLCMLFDCVYDLFD